MKVTVIAEVGINFQASVAVAIDTMRAAHAAGANVVKFQKRTVALAVPSAMKDTPRKTPWGSMRYEDYKNRMEIDPKGYALIASAAREIGIAWTASAFDPPSVAFLAKRRVPWIKLPSAGITDTETLAAARDTGIPLVLSTGGASWAEIDRAVDALSGSRLTLLHCCSRYPHTPEHARLLVLDELRQRYGLPVGYSGHEEPGTCEVTLGAVARGAVMVERHLTLSRHMWGSDHGASLEPSEFAAMVRQVRRLSEALTSGSERAVSEDERAKIETMRRSSWAKVGT